MGTTLSSSVPIYVQKFNPAILSFPSLVIYKFSGERPA
jgi:hypothetical protein